MRTPSTSSDYYHALRIPSRTAPWPEPPCPTHMKTFEFFPLLPSSVRKRVWHFALPGPRIIETRFANKQHEFRAPVPTILHVTREARAVGLLDYHTAVASPLNNLESALGHHYLTYVNFHLDTFCPSVSFRSFITGEWKALLRTLPNCEKIERFGLPKRCFEFPSAACIPLLLQYSNLREVVVMADPCIDHHPCIDDGRGTGWRLGPGTELPTMETFGWSGKEELMESHSIQFMDTLRKAWRTEHDWDLRFVYKGICWGGKCWEDRDKDIERQIYVEKKKTAMVKRMVGMPLKAVARLLMRVI